MTPHVLSLRLAHLENVLLKVNIDFMDTEHPMYHKINGLFNHIFRDLKSNIIIDKETTENVEQLIDESHIYFLTNVKAGVFEKITEARQLLYNKISPMSIVAKRLISENNATDIGVLDDLPALVRVKISNIINIDML